MHFLGVSNKTDLLAISVIDTRRSVGCRVQARKHNALISKIIAITLWLTKRIIAIIMRMPSYCFVIAIIKSRLTRMRTFSEKIPFVTVAILYLGRYCTALSSTVLFTNNTIAKHTMPTGLTDKIPSRRLHDP